MKYLKLFLLGIALAASSAANAQFNLTIPPTASFELITVGGSTATNPPRLHVYTGGLPCVGSGGVYTAFSDPMYREFYGMIFAAKFKGATAVQSSTYVAAVPGCRITAVSF